MLISVILANYNGAGYLAQALESVLAQEGFDDYEFIIVDDGSTDNSKEIIRDFATRHPERIRPILNDVNQGQAAGFNIGFEASRGELIAFMDSDDLWYPEKLRKLAAFYTENKHNNNALYQHNMNRMQVDKITRSRFHWTLQTGDLFAATRSSGSVPNFSPTSGLAFPRWALEKVMPIPLEFRICADGFLTRTAFCFGEVAATNQCWAAYRIHGDNNTYQNTSFDNFGYANGLLIPQLNRFYEARGIDLRFKPMGIANTKKPPTVALAEAPGLVDRIKGPAGRFLRLFLPVNTVEKIRCFFLGPR